MPANASWIGRAVDAVTVSVKRAVGVEACRSAAPPSGRAASARSGETPSGASARRSGMSICRSSSPGASTLRVVAGDEIDDRHPALAAAGLPDRADAVERGGQRDHRPRRQRHADVAADGRRLPDLERGEEGAAALADQRRGDPVRRAGERVELRDACRSRRCDSPLSLIVSAGHLRSVRSISRADGPAAPRTARCRPRAKHRLPSKRAVVPRACGWATAVMVFRSMASAMLSTGELCLRSLARPAPSRTIAVADGLCLAGHVALIRERRRDHGRNAGDLDQGSAGHSGRRRRARRRRPRTADRRAGAERRRARNRRRRGVRCRRPCRAARPDQHPSSFLPDADPGAAGGDGPRAVSLAAGALSGVGAADAGSARARRHRGDVRTAAVGLHHHDRSSLRVSRPGSKTPSISRSPSPSGLACACC